METEKQALMPKTPPVVSIVTITYNQEKYIRETLDSFVTQKTNFEFEAIVSDDCSTDKTPAIIEEFTSAYPNIIRPILGKKNIGAQPNFVNALRAAQGEYLAICDGDDYWTDPNKLQIQVDYLNRHPDYALCFHPVQVVYEDKGREKSIFPKEKTNFTTEELLKHNFIQTNSVMYRRQKYDSLPSDIMPGDWYLHLYHAKFGKIGFINKVMSVYRRHPGGIWWNSDKNADEIWKKYGLAHLNFGNELLKLYGDNDKFREIIYKDLTSTFGNLIVADKKYREGLLKKALIKYPEVAEPVIAIQYHQLQAKEASLQRKEGEIDGLKQAAVQKDQEIMQKDQEIKMIKLSRFWKMRNIVARLIGRKVI